LRIPVVTDALLVIILIIIGIRFGIGNKLNVVSGLYNSDINTKYDLLLHEGVDFIPKGSSVAFSDECFYWYYQCKLMGDVVSKCASGNEQYLVRFQSDIFPASDPDKYILIKTVFKKGITAVGYEIYKRK